MLDVVIRDKQGRPVRDVQQGELTVLEDGAAREIRSFRLVERTAAPSGPGLPSVAAEARRRRLPDALRYPTLVTLVFDHLTQNSRTLARRAALQFVAREMPVNQWVAVYALEQRLRLAHPFTRDRSALKSAIERATAGVAEGRDRLATGHGDRDQAQRSADAAVAAVTTAGSSAGAANIGAAVSEAQVMEVTARMERMVETADSQQRGQSTLFPLMALMKAQGTLAGRKALLFFSEGLPIPPNLEEAYRSAISEANRANVSIYAVDARGLDTGRSLEQSRQMLDRSGRNSQAQQAYGASQRPVTMDDVMNSETAEGALRADTQNALRTLAEETSGTLIANTNDLGPGLVDRVTADLDSYYEIGYTPTPASARWPLSSDRGEAGPQRAHRPFAQRIFRAARYGRRPLMPYELPMLAAAAADPPPHPFDYSVAAFRFDHSAKGVQHTLMIEVPMEHVTFQENRQTRTYALRFTAMALIKDQTGRVVQRFSEVLSARRPDRPRAPCSSGAGSASSVSSGSLRAATRCGRSRAIRRPSDPASSRCRSTCRNHRPAFGISELSVIRSVDPAGDAADTVEDPFRTGAMRVAPNLELPVSKAANTQISAYVTVYPGAAAGAPALTFEFILDGKVIGRSAAQLPEPDEAGRIKYVASFPTDDLRAGRVRPARRRHAGRRQRQLADPFRADSMIARLAPIGVFVVAAASSAFARGERLARRYGGVRL